MIPLRLNHFQHISDQPKCSVTFRDNIVLGKITQHKEKLSVIGRVESCHYLAMNLILL